MESNYDGNLEQEVRGAADRVAGDLGSGSRNVRSAASHELQSLIADVEDLVAKVAHLKDADVAKVRGRVETALASAKANLASGTDSIRRRARQVASSTDGYVRESPWQALGIAALVGAAIGFLVTRRD